MSRTTWTQWARRAVAVALWLAPLGPTSTALVTPAAAQEGRGTISGRVVDASAARMPGVVIAATNLATNVAVSAVTNTEGQYALPLLMPGGYRVTAALQGFQTVAHDRVELRIGDRLQVDFTMTAGAASETVEVKGQTPLLQTGTSTLGQVFDARRIAELPLPHGSAYSLMYLAPGVNNVYPKGFYYQTPTELNATSSMVAIQGAPLGTNEFTIDGVPNTQTGNANYGGGLANSPPADAIQEFKVETAFDASVGHTSGTSINVVLKSGANSLSGAGSLFFRNPSWNANSFFANAASQEKGDFNYERWGATISGPVILPRVYDGRNRTFFSYGYEGLYNELVSPITTSVPDAKFLNGDFSSLLALGSQYQIYDPATTRAVGNGRYQADPFPNNIIPSNRISPIALAILQNYPAPNVPGSVDGRNNYSVQNRPEPVTYWNHVARLDHNLTGRQRLSLRISAGRKDDGPYRNYWDGVTAGNVFVGQTYQASLDHIYTLNNSTLLNVRYGYARYEGGHQPRRLGFDVSTLGFPPNTVSTLSRNADLFPRFDLGGLESLAFEGYDVLNNDIHMLVGSVTKQWGRHQLKTGTDIRAYRDNVAFYGQASGRFNFDGRWTRGPFDNSPGSPGNVGQGLAQFLLGIPTGGFLDTNDNEAIQSTYWSAYVHDNWRVTDRLTVDLGLRWEYEGPTTERYDRAVRGFDPTAAQPIAAAARAAYAAKPDPALPVSQFQVQGGLQFAAENGQPRGFYDKAFTNFLPRTGFAYQLTKTVLVRGGVGMYTIPIGQPAQNRSIQLGFRQQTPIVPTLDNGLTFQSTLANPFPSGLLEPAGSAAGVETFLGRAISFYNPGDVTPKTVRWNTNVQLLLPGQFLAEIGYTGSRSYDLQIAHELNGVPNQYLSQSGVRDQAAINFLTAAVPNPFEGLLPGTSLNGATISRAQLLSPYPQFGSINAIDFAGSTDYQALQMRLERRMGAGFTAQAAYTFSKTTDRTQYLNAADAEPAEMISANDRPHQLTLSTIYELPFGRGRRHLSQAGRGLDMLVGGWQVGAIWLMTSGEPLTFGNVLFTGNLDDIALDSGKSVARWFNTDAGFNKSSSEQLDRNLRTFPLRLRDVRSGRLNNWDLSLLKNLDTIGRQRLQFRLEMFNVFNHQGAFAGIDTSPTSSTFGQVFDNYSVPRTIQIGLKYLF